MRATSSRGRARGVRRLFPLAASAAILAVAVTTAAASARDTAGASVTASDTDTASRAASPRDPALRMGRLPNGLTYYVRHNPSPKGRAELRLVVNAGSMQEDDDQLGFAHFLEHMAFNGTRSFPGQSLIEFVESAGMRFGADLNAYTSFDETVYLLTVPTDTARFLAQGLTVLHDWASGGIVIDSAEVAAERGVVLGEWRSRLPDTTSQRIQAHQRTMLFGAGSRYLERLPIGDTTQVVAATPAPLRRYYRDWYRPDLMAVVVVGDVDAAAVEREIVARFGAIAAPSQPRPRLAARVPVAAKGVVDVHRANVTPSVQLLWPVAAPPADPRALVEQQLVDRLLLQELEARFLRMRELASRPFIVATVQRGRIARPLEVVGLRMIAWPDSLERALATAVAEIERVAQHGIPAPTLALRKEAIVAAMERVSARGPRDEAVQPSGALAGVYTEHFLLGEGALLAPAQELALAREVLPTITPARVAEAARFWRSAEGRKVLFTVPALHTRPPTAERVHAIFDSVAQARLAPLAVRTAADGPLLERSPRAGTVTKEVRLQAAGITEWTLSNGARVLFKPSANDPDDLRIRAWSPGGFSRLPDSLFFTSGRMVARMMTEATGLGDRDRDALTAQLEGSGLRHFAVDIGYGEESITLAGSPTSLEMLFQLLHLQFTAPRLDSAALEAWKNYAKYQGRQFSLFDKLAQTFARGNPRMMPVSTHLAELARLDEAMAVYRDRFGNAGDFTFMIVGAATPEQVKPLVERYLAGLPATKERETPKDLNVAPFDMRHTSSSRPFDTPKASTILVFDGLFPTDRPETYLRERQRLSTLTAVLNTRFRARLREELGATYGVGVLDRTYPLPAEHYQVIISFDAAPEQMRAMQREMRGILNAVRDSGATEAELARTATMQRRQLETLLQDNNYWLERMGLFTRLGIPLDRIVNPFVDEVVTPAALSVAAKQYLPDDVYISITAFPDSGILVRPDSATTADERNAGAVGKRSWPGAGGRWPVVDRGFSVGGEIGRWPRVEAHASIPAHRPLPAPTRTSDRR